MVSYKVVGLLVYKLMEIISAVSSWSYNMEKLLLTWLACLHILAGVGASVMLTELLNTTGSFEDQLELINKTSSVDSNSRTYGYAWNIGSGASYMRVHIGDSRKRHTERNFKSSDRKEGKAPEKKEFIIEVQPQYSEEETLNSDCIKQEDKVRCNEGNVNETNIELEQNKRNANSLVNTQETYKTYQSERDIVPLELHNKRISKRKEPFSGIEKLVADRNGDEYSWIPIVSLGPRHAFEIAPLFGQIHNNNQLNRNFYSRSLEDKLAKVVALPLKLPEDDSQSSKFSDEDIYNKTADIHYLPKTDEYSIEIENNESLLEPNIKDIFDASRDSEQVKIKPTLSKYENKQKFLRNYFKQKEVNGKHDDEVGYIKQLVHSQLSDQTSVFDKTKGGSVHSALKSLTNPTHAVDESKLIFDSVKHLINDNDPNRSKQDIRSNKNAKNKKSSNSVKSENVGQEASSTHTSSSHNNENQKSSTRSSGNRHIGRIKKSEQKKIVSEANSYHNHKVKHAESFQDNWIGYSLAAGRDGFNYGGNNHQEQEVSGNEEHLQQLDHYNYNQYVPHQPYSLNLQQMQEAAKVYALNLPPLKEVTKSVPVEQTIRIPVMQPIRQAIPIPVPVGIPQPYPIKIPVPIQVEKTVKVPVEKIIPYQVEKPVPMKVVKEVPYPVPKPFPVKVPVVKFKYIHHTKKPHHH